MVAPPGHRTRRASIVTVITFLVVAMVAGGCSGKPKDDVLVSADPATPGTLTVATTLPAPGFWEGDDVYDRRRRLRVGPRSGVGR